MTELTFRQQTNTRSAFVEVFCSNLQMRIGQVFRYSKPFSSSPAEIDGFPNFFHITHLPGAKFVLLERGIDRIARVVSPDGDRRPAILISSSPHKIGSEETPWQDVFNPDIGHIRYFGDNQQPGKDPAKASGNMLLLEQFGIHTSPDASIRKHAVPLLFFRRVPHGGKTKGFLEFHGFGIVTHAELLTQFHPKLAQYFTNYVFDFCVLSLASESEVFSWDWISARRNSSKTLSETLNAAPDAWRIWNKGGPPAVEKCRRRVSRLQTVSTATQQPIAGSDTERVLKEIYGFYEGKKHRFENLASFVAASVIRSNGERYKECWLTHSVSDGGADFIGRLDVGQGFSLAKIIVLGQAKCEKPKVATGGNHIARTVARLRRGWIGVYVTTSYFSEPVQREIIEDRYPIMLINGRMLADEVRKLVQEGGHSSVADFLLHLDGRYESMVANRHPEEALLV
jgi:Restriction endonuclease AspBHI N-terminal/Restriction endonuclease